MPANTVNEAIETYNRLADEQPVIRVWESDWRRIVAERDQTRAAVRAFIDHAWFRGRGPCPGCGFGRKLDGSTFHGTGCTLAALAAQVEISADPPGDPYAGA